MSDAWALFGSDDDDDDDDDAGAANKRHRADGAAAGAAAKDGEGGAGFGGFGAPRGGKTAAATAADHAYFATSRQLWPSEARSGGDDPSSSSSSTVNLEGFLDSLAADASRRVTGIATRLRKFKPEGPSAAAALTAAEAAAAAGNWPAAARAATECLAAHSRQLDVGNWPDECWQESHTLALGMQIAADLCGAGNEGEEGAAAASTAAATVGAAAGGGGGGTREVHYGQTVRGGGAADAAQAQLAENPVAAAALRASVERWSPATRLGRVALEALSMASLAADAGAIPSWLGAAILLAERACIAALSAERRGGADAIANVFFSVGGGSASGGWGGGRGGAERDASAYLIPDTLPVGAPEVSPSRAVARVPASALTVADFHSRYVRAETPVVIAGLATASFGWAGAEEWRDLRRLLETNGAGERLVPVEFGGFGDRRGTGVIALGDLVREYLLESNASHRTATAAAGVNARTTSAEEDRSSPRMPSSTDEDETAVRRTGGGSADAVRVAYMSQHALFHQVPELQTKFAVPPYTMGRLRADTGAVNAWIGTKDTTTALHRDPYLNLLAQAAGFKYARLYAADQTHHLYAETAVRGGNDNTFTRSAVAVEAPDLAKHPRFEDAEYLEAVLGPGDVLFMPKGMWHYVRSITTSVSVNFWWI